jgi:hypothetical protein
MIAFFIVALLAFVLSNLYDLKLTREGLRKGVAVEKSSLSMKGLLIRDGVILAGVTTVGILASFYSNTPLVFLMGVCSAVGAVKHFFAARRWAKLLR